MQQPAGASEEVRAGSWHTQGCSSQPCHCTQRLSPSALALLPRSVPAGQKQQPGLGDCPATRATNSQQDQLQLFKSPCSGFQKAGLDLQLENFGSHLSTAEAQELWQCPDSSQSCEKSFNHDTHQLFQNPHSSPYVRHYKVVEAHI